jgi:hypothetical protein
MQQIEKQKALKDQILQLTREYYHVAHAPLL